jgi:hypothetical protein
MWRRVDILLTDVSQECIASIFGVEKIHERWTSSLQPPAHADSSLMDFFYPEDGGDTFLRNVG